MAEWTTVARISDLAEADTFGTVLDAEDLLIVRVGDQYRAVGAVCTHAGCNLAEDGELEESTVVCLCHGSMFDVDTGEATGPPADEPLSVYDVRVEGDEIQVARRG